MSFIPESDVYRLTFGSKLPTAEKFTDWVTDEILPSIRKHGLYATPDTIEKMLGDPDSMILMLETIKEERRQKAALEVENTIQAQRLAEYEPRIQYLDKILGSKGTLTTKTDCCRL